MQSYQDNGERNCNGSSIGSINWGTITLSPLTSSPIWASVRGLGNYFAWQMEAILPPSPAKVPDRICCGRVAVELCSSQGTERSPTATSSHQSQKQCSLNLCTLDFSGSAINPRANNITGCSQIFIHLTSLTAEIQSLLKSEDRSISGVRECITEWVSVQCTCQDRWSILALWAHTKLWAHIQRKGGTWKKSVGLNFHCPTDYPKVLHHAILGVTLDSWLHHKDSLASSSTHIWAQV